MQDFPIYAAGPPNPDDPRFSAVIVGIVAFVAIFLFIL